MDKENEYDPTENGYERTEDDYSQSEDNYTRPEKDFTRKEKDFIRLPVNSDDELPQKPQRRSLWRVSKELGYYLMVQGNKFNPDNVEQFFAYGIRSNVH